MPAERSVDVVVIGGGQAGLAVGWYLRRTSLRFVILDAQAEPGGAWERTWDSLRLFSPARWSSLPRWPMQGGEDDYPHRDEVIDYLAGYEERYAFPVRRPVRVTAVRRDGRGGFRVESDDGAWNARAVVSATGTWERPWVPPYAGRDLFRGEQVHSAFYRSPGPFAGKQVLVVGGGNSGAQILAEVSQVAETTWVTLQQPRFLADSVDGRFLFDQATARYRAQQQGLPAEPPMDLGDIVMVEPVREARDRGALTRVRPFHHCTRGGVAWPDGTEAPADAVLWGTGFRPALEHLAPLDLVGAGGRIEVRGTRALHVPNLWLVGYGDWTGFASATLIGVGRTARATVDEIVAALQPGESRFEGKSGAGPITGS